MTFGDLKKAVAAYCRRELGSFTTAGYDLLPLVINQTRKYAEKKVDFEFSKDQAKLLQVNLTAGASLSSIVNFDGTPCNVKGIQQVWTTNDQLVPQIALELMKRQQYQYRLQRRNQGVQQQAINMSRQPYDGTPLPPTLVLHGTKLYLYPNDSNVYSMPTQDLLLDVVKWLPDYVNDTDTDFIMEHGSDWLIFQSMIRLNFFLKEDQRVAVESAVVNDSWKVLTEWNDGLVAARVQSYNLD